MAELVSHEVQVGAAVESAGSETGHFVQRDCTLDLDSVLILAHAAVDCGVRQLEEEGLAADKSLVMRLHVGNDLLFGPLVGELPEDAPHRPVVVSDLFGETEPEVGLAHRHAVVEADAAVLGRRRDAGHSAHVLGDGDRGRLRLMDDAVCEL